MAAAACKVEISWVPEETPWFHLGAASLSGIAADSGIGDNRTGVRTEQLADLVLDAGDDLAVKKGDHSGDQERAEDNGDDDLDAFGDVEVAVFVFQRLFG